MIVLACIPTCKDLACVTQQQNAMLSTVKLIKTVYVSAKKTSAAVNRNNCLEQAGGADIIIMLDDDIEGFYSGWDEDLIAPLIVDPNIYLVSARLMDKNGCPGAMMHNNNNYSPGWFPPKAKFVPTSCIAFRRTNIRFDEKYVGSGFEDTDFCKQLELKFPAGRVVINNNCRLIHLNEQKQQLGDNWVKNRAYYVSKWGSV